MNDTMKAAGRIGAELGAAKAENEAMRILLRESYSELLVMKTEVGFRGKTLELIDRIDAFLSRQPEPTETYTAVEMATAAAQGFRDGQAAVEQATAQDERWAVHAQGPDELYAAFSREDAEQHAAALNALSMPAGIQVSAIVVESPWPAAEHWKYLAEQERDHVAELRATRPAQTEQQPVAWLHSRSGAVATEATKRAMEDGSVPSGYDIPLYAAPIAQAAPQGYVLLPKQCPSWLEDAYDDQCEKDKWHGDGLYLPAYDAMVAALSAPRGDA